MRESPHPSSSVVPPALHELLDLNDRVVLVTGSGAGIGAGIARRAHAAGARVALHYATHADAAKALAAELGERTCVVHGDVERDAGALCDAVVAAFGRIDALVNNAAIQPVGALLALTEADVAEMLRVDVAGCIAMTREAAECMIAGGAGGTVVNIASIEGLHPAVGHSHYAAAKAALLMHTRAAALELGAQAIRVNAVAPGLIDAPGLADAWPDGVGRWTAACPLARLGMPEDVADAVLFLLAPASRWISGATLIVDGGMLARPTW